MREIIAQWASLTDAQWSRFATLFQQRSVPVNTSLLLPGDSVHELIFVSEGLLRFYYLDEEGVESNKAFIRENEFAGPLASASLGMPVIYGIQTLEPSILLTAPYADFVSLFDMDPVYDRIGRKFAELLLIRKELRMRNMLQKKAKERYLDFRSRYPDLLQRIPQYHIASFLGITEVSLSRLRRSLADTPVTP